MVIGKTIAQPTCSAMVSLLIAIATFIGFTVPTVAEGQEYLRKIPSSVTFPAVSPCPEEFVIRREKEGTAWNLLPAINRFVGDYCGETGTGKTVNFSITRTKKKGKQAILTYYLLVDGKVRANPSYGFMLKTDEQAEWLAHLGPSWISYLVNSDEMRLWLRNNDGSTELTATLHRVPSLTKPSGGSTSNGGASNDR